MNPTIAPHCPTLFAHVPSPPKRRAIAASVVTGLYVALVLCAPLIIRYVPAAEVRTTAVAVQPAGLAQCSPAREFALSCRGATGAGPVSRVAR